MEANTETTSNKIKFEGSQRNAGHSRFQMTKSVGAIWKILQKGAGCNVRGALSNVREVQDRE